MIYTSYFGNHKKFPKGYKLVSIARFPIKRFVGEELKDFAPSEYLLSSYKDGLINETIYEKLYLNEIKDKDLNQIEDNSILLCYEKAGEFCHRHILARILNDMGRECKEL